MAALSSQQQSASIIRSMPGRRRVSALLCGALAVSTGLTGCSRAFWRNQADRDAYEAIGQKLSDERWAVPRVELAADPRSRFYEPNNPDCLPLPPDDAAAHVYMHWVDGWQGYKSWHKFGDLMSVENPQWLASFGIKSDAIDPISGEYIAPVPAIENMTLQQAVELTTIHNRDYQTQLENVFQAALDVTFARYDFAVQYVTQPNGAITGNFIPAAGERQTVGASGGLGLRQVLPAGTSWAVNLANTTLWTFSGTGTTTSASTLGFTIVQPLFQQAGRKVGLEFLTQAERDLLYATRTLARFRKQLFVNVVGGNTGFLGLLRQLQSIRNQIGNVERTERQLRRLLSAASPFNANELLDQLPAGLQPVEGERERIAGLPPVLGDQLRYNSAIKRLRWGGEMSDEQEQALLGLSEDPAYQTAVQSIIEKMRRVVATIDILQLQSSLAQSINQLRQSESNFQDSQDSFKFLIGLPPDMYLTIDDGLLKPFELIEPVMPELEREVTDFVNVWGLIDEQDPDPAELQRTLSTFNTLVQSIDSSIPALVDNDIARVKEALPGRLETLGGNPQDAQQLKVDIARALVLNDDARARLTAIIDGVQTQLQRMQTAATVEDRKLVYESINELRERLLSVVQNFIVVQVSLRVELIDLQPFDLSLEEVIALAMENRLDLMNQRAIVMDARRRVEVTANALNGVVDLVVDADFRTPNGDNTLFEFRGDESSISTGLEFTAPTDRVAQRNNYRNALIAYQQARRTYMQQEDIVKRDVRSQWRQLIIFRKNLETSRRAVRIAALQYDSAVNESAAPTGNVNQGGGGGGRGLTGQNLLSALRSILDAQNQLIQNWISYEQNRLNIYRDMDIMVVGPDGVWNDPFYRDQDYDQNEAQGDVEPDGFPDGQFHPLDPDSGGSGGLGGDGLGDGTARP